MLSIISPKIVKIKLGPFGVYYWIKPYTVRMMLTAGDPFFAERAIEEMAIPVGILGRWLRVFCKAGIFQEVNRMIIASLPDIQDPTPAADRKVKSKKVTAEEISQAQLFAMAEFLPRAAVSMGQPLSEILNMTYLDMIWFARVADQMRMEDKMAAIAAGGTKPPTIQNLTPDKRYKEQLKASKKLLDADLFIKLQQAALQAGSKEVH